MNNNRISLINQISAKYNLNQEEINVIIEKFKDDKRDINIISKEIEIIANYFGYQNYFNNIVRNTSPLPLGKSN